MTFSRDMAPHSAGDTRLVFDTVADDLQKADCLSASEPWPAPANAAAAQKPTRAVLKPARPVGTGDERMAK